MQKDRAQRAAAGGAVYVAGLMTGVVRTLGEVARAAEVDATDVASGLRGCSTSAPCGRLCCGRVT